MAQTILISVLATSFIWIAIFYFTMKKHSKELISQYKQGFEDSEDKKSYSFQLIPFEKVVENGNFFKSKKSVIYGYTKTLLINGIPTAYSETITLKTISSDKVNDENVKLALQTLNKAIDAAILINNPITFNVQKNAKTGASNLSKFIKKQNSFFKKLKLFSKNKSKN